VLRVVKINRYISKNLATIPTSYFFVDAEVYIYKAVLENCNRG